MDDLLRRLVRMRRADLPQEDDTNDNVQPYDASPTAAEKVLELVSRVTTPSNLDGTNETLGNNSMGVDSSTISSVEDEPYTWPIKSFAVVKAVVLVIILGILLLTSCKVVGNCLLSSTQKRKEREAEQDD